MKTIFYKIEDLYYNIKGGIKSFIKYLPIVWEMRDWDYIYLFQMMKFQLNLLLKTIKKGHEIDETRIPKEKDIQRCIILLDNLIKDDYMERCGYESDRTRFKIIPLEDNPKLTKLVDVHPNCYLDEEFHKILEESEKLQQQELKELFDIMNKNCLSWWD